MDVQRTSMKEEAVIFGEAASLVGIVTPRSSQATSHARTAVILLNPGIVHRVGAGRIYVKVARALASIGFTALRFDFSGIGDSPVREDSLQFSKSAVAETRNAMDFLAQTRGIEHFILLGGCSGANVAFDTACCDSRVTGAVLINFPSLEDEQEIGSIESSERGAFVYYRKYALFDWRSWSRFVTGKAHYGQLCKVLWCELTRRMNLKENISKNAVQFRLHLSALVERNVQLIFVCSEADHRLDDLKEAGGNLLKQMCAKRRVTLDVIRRSDHTFSSLSDQKRLMQVLLKRADAMMHDNREASRLPSVAATSKVLPQCQG